MNLNSGISKFYKECFTLEEDSLRRIEGVLLNFAKRIEPQPKVVYRVEREDDRFYETHSLEDVLSDPNIDNKQIVLVCIFLRHLKKLDNNMPPEEFDLVTLKFSSNEKWRKYRTKNEVQFNISHEDKSWALLLADELEPQINRVFKSHKVYKIVFVLLLIPILLVVNKLSTYQIDENIKWVLTIVGILLFFPAFSLYSDIAIKDSPPKWYSRYIGPESIFNWGEELNRHKYIVRLRQNIIWGIVVGFCIEIAAAYYLFFLIGK